MADGPNLYEYAQSNPIVRLDVKGTDTDRTFNLGLRLDESGLQFDPGHSLEMNRDLTTLGFGLAASLSRGSTWKTVLGGLSVWWMSSMSHEGSHFREADKIFGMNPHINYALGFIPYETSYARPLLVTAETEAGGINQNVLNARQYWPILKLGGGERSVTEGIAYWLQHSYLLNYTVRAMLGISKDKNDVLRYSNKTGASPERLFAHSVATNALSLASELFAGRIERLLHNKVMAPRFQTLLLPTGETLFGMQTLVKPSWCWPSIEVNLDTTSKLFSTFSLETKVHDFKLSSDFSISPFGSFGKTKDPAGSGSNWAGSIGTDVKFQVNPRMSAGASIGFRGDGNPVNQIEGKAPGWFGSLNMQVTLP
jgi:hypothetical protein